MRCEIKNKFYLSLEGKNISGTNWDNATLVESEDYVIFEREVQKNTFTIICYDMRTGETMFCIKNVSEYKMTSYGVIVTRKDNIHGSIKAFYNYEGICIIPFGYKDIQNTYESIADPLFKGQFIVSTDEYMGLYDYNGNELICCKYKNIEACEWGGYIVEDEEKKGIYFCKNNRFVEPQFSKVELEKKCFKQIVYVDGIEYNYNEPESHIAFSLDGETLFPFTCREIKCVKLSNNNIVFKVKTTSDKIGVYSIDGKTIIEAEYDNLNIYHSIIRAYKSGKIKIFDIDGKELISGEHDLAESMGMGNCILAKDGNEYTVYINDGKSFVPVKCIQVKKKQKNYFRYIILTLPDGKSICYIPEIAVIVEAECVDRVGKWIYMYYYHNDWNRIPTNMYNNVTSKLKLYAQN